MEADRSRWCPAEDLQRIVCAQLEKVHRERDESCFDCAEVDGGSILLQPGRLSKDSPQSGVRTVKFWPGDAFMPEGERYGR